MATPIETTVIRLLTVVVCFLAAPTTVVAQLACGRLLSASAAELLTGTDPSFKHRVFKEGISCQSDDNLPALPGKCDTEGRIVDDRVLDSRAGSERRLIRVTDNHVTGSGGWDFLRVFICVGGHTAPVFQDKFLYGVRVEEASQQTLSLLSGEWRRQDPMCCPSWRKRQVYRWDGVRRLYVLDSLTYIPVEKELR